ncbi:Zn-dependent protease [Bacillus circulans]|nr:DUF2268 domain-containing putative Zn-dependent protease [Niallia circulans]NRG30051.1 Zn-dependent protease [Niallia circulans]
MRGIKYYLLIFTIFFLSSCQQNEVVEQEEKVKEGLTYSFQHPETGQAYNIIHVYKLYENFEKRMKKDVNMSESQVFDEEVINPIYEACYQDAEYFTETVKAPENREEVNNIIQTMDVKAINSAIEESLIKSSNYIPSNQKTNICIYPTEATKSTTLMFTEGAGKISVLYNEFFNEETLKAGIAHEYHHSVWTEKYFNNSHSHTVLDNLILEGKAVMFEKLVYPDITLTTVNYNFNKDDWNQIEPDLFQEDSYRAAEIISGGNGLPYNYGYNVGYQMMRSYLDLHPDFTPQEWTALGAREIYEEGKYNEHYQ